MTPQSRDERIAIPCSHCASPVETSMRAALQAQALTCPACHSPFAVAPNVLIDAVRRADRQEWRATLVPPPPRTSTLR